MARPMNAVELRRRARFLAAELVTGSVEAGMDVASYTETSSDEETEALSDAILAVADMIRATLPEGYTIDMHPADRERIDRIGARP
jgi:hypothetical protein